MDTLLSLSNEYAYFRDGGPKHLRDELKHDPWFWAIPKKGEDAGAALSRIRRAWEGTAQRTGPDSDLNPLAKIKGFGDVETIRSFANHGVRRPAFKVFAKRSFNVPEISDELFLAHGMYTAEHDIPYHQRACIDLASTDTAWPFDTRGQKTSLKVLIYDIETTQFGKTKTPPVDMIGFSEFELSYSASKDLDKEEFHFEILDAPPRWQDCEVTQLQARTPDEEVDMLLKFARKIPNYHIISGHNILAFDNKEIMDRVQHYLAGNERTRTLSERERRAFEEFAGNDREKRPGKWAARDRTFTFGQQSEIATFHPTSLDTYHATRRFYFFLDDFTLKKVAPFLGVVVPNRVYLSPNDLKLDDSRTLDYNRHDCQEQTGITMLLLAQALPLAFTTGWTFEEVLSGGNVRMWDHMAAIRAARQKKIMPATCRAQGVARTVLKNLGTRPTKELIADDARSRMRDPQPPPWLKEYARVAKYGDEMPDWLELPHVIVNPKAVQEGGPNLADANGDDEGDEEEQELLGYAIPGGMTIHPQEVKSQFVPWWYVVDADVGAMYPTILRARNVGPDTVRLARNGETPDDWVWLYKVNDEFTKDDRWLFRPPGPEENFAKPGEGVMVGVKITPEPGLVPLAMKGILSIAVRLKRQLGKAKKDPSVSKGELERLQMAYASIKATRNAGTHGQMLAVNVSCRGFNLWAGAEITTIGQKILADSLVDLNKIGARVVYGDSIDGSRCITVRDPKGFVHVAPIQTLWDRMGGARHLWHGKDAAFGNGWEALSRDPSDAQKNPEWKPITRIIRHRTDKKLVRLGQGTGETVCTTDHSLMRRVGNRLEKATPEEMMHAPMVRARCPRNETLETLDLAQLLGATAAEMDLAPLALKPGSAPRVGFDEDRVWIGEARRSGQAHGGRMAVKRFIRVGSREMASLCKILGASLADRSVHIDGARYGASIANSDVASLTALASDHEELVLNHETKALRSPRLPQTILLANGTEPTHPDATFNIQMTNRLATLVVSGLGGRESSGKRIPSFVFNLPREHQLELLDKMVEGDGSRARGPRDSAEVAKRHFRYATNSLELSSGLCVLLDQLGIDYGVRYQPKEQVYVVTTRDAASRGIDASTAVFESSGLVYDLEVADYHTFVDACGSIVLHNTDGIYLGCSRSGRNMLTVGEALGDEQPAKDDTWILQPDAAYAAINDLNLKWRKYLGYEEFELEAGHHDAMIFVVHKNYLIFDVKNGKLRMQTKGNNFRGSDKAPVAQKVLETIMVNSLRDLIEWDDEEKAREAMKAAIKRYTQEAIKTLDPSKFERDDLTLIQVVQPADSYARVGLEKGESTWTKRARALEQVTGERLRASKKYRFVVCKKPLPGIDKPSAKGLKPLDYMWPLEALENPKWKGQAEIDLGWYKDMITKYVRGAFGFEDLELHAQKGLDAWM